MSKNLFFVAIPGERHEDMMPLGIFDYETFKKKFPHKKKYSEETISNGEWNQIDFLNINEWKFTEEEVENFINIPDWYPYNDLNYEGQTLIINVIKIEINATMPIL